MSATFWMWIGLIACGEKSDSLEVGDDSGGRNLDSGELEDSGGADSEGGDTAPGGDSGEAEDSGDTQDSGDSGAPSACPLDAPWTFAEPVDVAVALLMSGASELEFHNAIAGLALARAPGESCPSIIEVPGRVIVEAKGGCTSAEGVYFSGSFYLDTNKDETEVALTYEGFSLSFEDPKGGASYSATGVISVVQESESESAINLELEEARSLTGGYQDDDFPNGHFVRSTAWIWTAVGPATTVISGEGTVSVTESEWGYAGDFCFEGQLSVSEACEEGDGSFSFSGAQEATLVFDGSKACDGCVQTSIDGAAGEFCY